MSLPTLALKKETITALNTTNSGNIRGGAYTIEGCPTILDDQEETCWCFLPLPGNSKGIACGATTVNQSLACPPPNTKGTKC